MPRPTLEKLISRTTPVPCGGDICLRWTGAINGVGYGRLSWSEGGKVTHRDAHRLVVEIREGRPLACDEWVLHSCDNRWCINPAHLRLGTAKENQQESWAKGRAGSRSRPGVGNGRAKITEALVRAIRASPLPPKRIADSFGLHWATIYKIRTRKLWNHIP